MNDGFFEIQFFNPIDIKNFNNKNEISKELNLFMEKLIMKKPSQWIWTHDRWK